MTKVLVRGIDVGRTLLSAAFDFVFDFARELVCFSSSPERQNQRQERRTGVSAPHVLCKLLGQEFIHDLRAGLAFGGFHDLADEEADHGRLSGTVLF
jgi:hypothetical protein